MLIKMTLTIILAFSILSGIIILRYAAKRLCFPGALYLIVLIIGMIIYDAGYIGEINSTSYNWAMFWFHFEHLTIPSLPFLWLMMTLDFTQILPKISKRIKTLLYLYPVAYYLIYFTNSFHHLYITSYTFVNNGYFYVIHDAKGPLYIAVAVSISIIGLVCCLSYINSFIKAVRMQRFRFIIMLGASVLQWFTVVLNASTLNYLGIDYFPVFTGVSGLLYMFGIFRFVLLDTVPIAKEVVYRKSKEGIALIDISGSIIETNDTFKTLFPKISGLKGKNIGILTSSYPELNMIFQAKTKSPFQRCVNGKISYYSAELTKIMSDNDLILGQILTVVDITLFVEHERKLKTLARNAMESAERSELSFLQAQISPHFLANTLSVVSSLIQNDSEAAKKLVSDLGEYLTAFYQIENTSIMISLDFEIKIIETFVRIEQARFGERIRFEVDCDIDRFFKIPKLILQPLVENAIRHGILKKPEGGRVVLCITRDDKLIYFNIKDDGVGISKDKIDGLLNGDICGKSVGITNINKRLLKLYGAGLSIISEEGKGTEISFQIPCASVEYLVKEIAAE